MHHDKAGNHEEQVDAGVAQIKTARQRIRERQVVNEIVANMADDDGGGGRGAQQLDSENSLRRRTGKDLRRMAPVATTTAISPGRSDVIG